MQLAVLISHIFSLFKKSQSPIFFYFPMFEVVSAKIVEIKSKR